MEMKKYMKILFVSLSIAFIAFGGGVLYLSQKDVAVDYAKASAQRMASEKLGATLSVGKISGNPIRGYTVSGISLNKDGILITKARGLSLKLDPLALLLGKTKVRSVKLSGGEIFADNLPSLFTGQEEKTLEKLPDIKLSIVQSTIRTKESSVGLDSVRLSSSNGALSLHGKVSFKGLSSELEGRGSFKNGKLSLERFKATIGKGNIEVKGDIYPTVACTGKVSDLDLEVVSFLWPALKDKGFSGSFSTSLEIEGPWREVGLRGSLSMDKGQIWGIPVEGLRSNWWSRGRKLWFEDISGFANNSKVSGKLGMLFSALPPELYFDLDVQDGELVQWTKTFPWLGFASGSIEKAHIGFAVKRGKVVGPARVEASSVTMAGQPIENLTATLDFKENYTSLVTISGRWLDAPVAGSGIIRIKEGPYFDFTLSGKGIALNKARTIVPVEGMKLEGLAGGTVRISGTPGKISSDGKLWSEKIRVMGHLIENPAVEFAYSNSMLQVKDLSATWNSLPIRGSGKVSGLGSQRASLLFSGTGGKVNLSKVLQAAGISIPNLKSEVSTSWKVTGSISNPDISLSFSSSFIKGPYDIELSDITMWTDLPLSAISQRTPTAKISFKAQKGSLRGLHTGPISGKASYSQKEVLLEGLSLSLWDSQLTAKGKILMPQKEKEAPHMEFEGSVEKANLAKMGEPFKLPLKGTLNGTFKVTGSLLSPEVAASFLCDELTFRDYSFSNAEGQISVKDGIAKIVKGTARIGEGTVSVKGSFPIKKEKDADLSLSIEGNNLDLALFTKESRQARAMNLGGLINLAVEASRSRGDWSGSGEINSDTIKLHGLTISNFHAPLSFSGDFLKVYKAKGTFYGGSATADALFNLRTGKWSAMIATSNTNIEGVVKDALSLKGKVTGKGDLNLNLEGSFTKPMPIKGNGRFSAKDGEISDFKAIKIIAAPHGLSSIRYSNVETYFNILGNTLTLMPGSRMTAYPQDPLYRYLTADGTLGPGSSINLNCSGNINMQTLNALVGAIQGIMGSDIQNPQELLSGLLGGLVGGLSKQDFRDVSFHVSGTWEKPMISNIKVYSPAKSQPIPEDNTDPSVKDDQTKVNINIPTNGSDESVGDQLKQQILEQIFKQSVPSE